MPVVYSTVFESNFRHKNLNIYFWSLSCQSFETLAKYIAYATSDVIDHHHSSTKRNLNAVNNTEE